MSYEYNDTLFLNVSKAQQAAIQDFFEDGKIPDDDSMNLAEDMESVNWEIPEFNGTTSELADLIEEARDYKLVPVNKLKEGMMVDLEGDEYADPKKDKTYLATEYMIVDYIEKETKDCIAIGFSSFYEVGFPTDHKLKVKIDD